MTIKFINKNIGMELIKICNFLNRLLHEVLGHAPNKILKIFLCKVNIFPLLEELPPPPKISPCFKNNENMGINQFWSGYVANIAHQSYCIT